ncbi:hypothetical protein PoB_003269400 [Plakobranchus ocellatus]|uniref:Uncharacterized protein n=1 Tax=Plakobranchus ocellatus TaxID=259542 RepID=A0AAV4AIC4_9GAST|nr:hypothetical protein PoB_003269400 [Plakobranchus ocellatus]
MIISGFHTLRQVKAPVAEFEPVTERVTADLRAVSLSTLPPKPLLFVPVHNKVISGFKALRQAGAPMAGLEPATEGSLQISGRTHKALCHRRPQERMKCLLFGK